MSVLRVTRIVGFVFIVLGFGSAYMRTQFNIDTVLTAWMAGAQPWAGIVFGVVGIALVIAVVLIGKRRVAD